MAMDELDVRPRSTAMRSRWEAAGEKVKRGRPRKRPDAKSRIVPVSIEPALLEQVDQGLLLICGRVTAGRVGCGRGWSTEIRSKDEHADKKTKASRALHRC